MAVFATSEVSDMAAKKKMSMKQALKKYDDSPEDIRKDRAGAKRLMAMANKKGMRSMGSKRGY
jgi:hypothetical protein